MATSGRWRVILAGLLVLGPTCLLLWWAGRDLLRRDAAAQAEQARQLRDLAGSAMAQRLGDVLDAALRAAQAVGQAGGAAERLAALRRPELACVSGLAPAAPPSAATGPRMSGHPLLLAARRLEFSGAEAATVLAAYARVVAESGDPLAIDEARAVEVVRLQRAGRTAEAETSFAAWLATPPAQPATVVSLGEALGPSVFARVWAPVVLGLWPCPPTLRETTQTTARRLWPDGERQADLAAADRLLRGWSRADGLAAAQRQRLAGGDATAWLDGEAVAATGAGTAARVTVFFEPEAVAAAVARMWAGRPAGATQELRLDTPWGRPLAIQVPLATTPARAGWPQLLVLGAALLAILAGLGSLLLFYLRNERLARLKTAFVADVSHELKTPLALMRLYAEMLDSGYFAEDAAEGRRALRVILAECDRLGHLVENILDVSRLERGARAFRFAALDLAAVAQQAAEGWRPEIERRGGTLTVTLAALPPLLGDAEALTQVLVNLLSNAVKFSPETCAIEVALRAEGGWAVLTFADRGIGVPEGDRDRLFTPFHRAENACMLAIRGTGLGLVLVARIIAAHGGSVRLLPRDGGGTIAEVRLPGGEVAHGR